MGKNCALKEIKYFLLNHIFVENSSQKIVKRAVKWTIRTPHE